MDDVTIEQAEDAKNCLNLLWACYNTSDGIMPHGMIKRRNPKTMNEVRQYGKGPDSVFFFEKYPDRPLDYSEVVYYKKHTEELVLKIQEQERYNAVLKKVMAVLTDSEFELLFKYHQPQG